MLSKTNISKRLEWANNHINWTKEDFQRVLYSDECRVIASHNGIKFVRKYDHEEWDALPEFTDETDKFSLGIMVWVCIGYSGVLWVKICSKTVDSTYYTEDILTPFLNNVELTNKLNKDYNS